MVGRLYIVATPIGNLEDITLRAINTLKSCDIIACEDTRHTKILLDKYDIRKTLVSYYSFNQVKRTDHLIEEMKAGKTISLVTDAGTPGISDPGYVIIRAAIDNSIPLEHIPGPCAAIAALVISGKPTHKFIFEGFLSNKSSARRKRLEELKSETRTVVIYESPHRIVKLLEDILLILGDREIVCAREMTKKFEETIRGPVSQVLARYSQSTPKGEFVVVF